MPSNIVVHHSISMHACSEKQSLDEGYMNAGVWRLSSLVTLCPLLVDKWVQALFRASSFKGALVIWWSDPLTGLLPLCCVLEMRTATRTSPQISSTSFTPRKGEECSTAGRTSSVTCSRLATCTNEWTRCCAWYVYQQWWQSVMQGAKSTKYLLSFIHPSCLSGRYCRHYCVELCC